MPKEEYSGQETLDFLTFRPAIIEGWFAHDGSCFSGSVRVPLATSKI